MIIVSRVKNLLAIVENFFAELHGETRGSVETIPGGVLGRALISKECDVWSWRGGWCLRCRRRSRLWNCSTVASVCKDKKMGKLVSQLMFVF